MWRELMDDILGLLNLTDLVQGWIEGTIHGDPVGHRITLPHPESDEWENHPGDFWNLNDVRRFLAQYHIHTYGRGFNGREIWVHVSKKQARWAEYLLLRAGAPVKMSTIDPRNPGWAAQHSGLPEPWDEQRRRRA